MTLLSAATSAYFLSFMALVMAGNWYVTPWLVKRGRTEALTLLLWVHAFRHVALQIYSAQQFGFHVSDSARDQIAAGDVIGMALALLTIGALRYRAGIGVVLAWIFVAEAVFDLVNSGIAAVRENLFETASGVTWLILTFYDPLLLASLVLIVVQLTTRRSEPLVRSPA